MATEIRALRDSERNEHAELVYRSYSHERELPERSMLTHPDWWLWGAERDPYYEPEQTRLMAIDGNLVSSVTCYLRPSHIAGRVVKACCLGSVCTHPDYRGRGLLRQVLSAAAEWMAGQGVLWSFLYGREAIYGGSGWRHLASWALTADLRVQDGFGEGIAARPADPETDAPLLSEIYDAFNAGLTGATHRTEQYWRGRVLPSPGPWAAAPVYCLLERGGRAIGYYRGANAAVSEVAWRESPCEVLAFLLRQWPDRPVSLPLYTAESLDCLRTVSAVPPQQEVRTHPASIALAERDQGLWRYFQDPDGLFPDVYDTESLLCFLRARDYAMWNADKA